MLEEYASQLVKFALQEDLVGGGDVTTLNALPTGVGARAAIVAHEEGIAAGLFVAKITFNEVDPKLKFSPLVKDGELVKPGVALARVSGPAGGILTAERTALNFLAHLCGIATMTRRFVKAVEGTGAVILDTRKTTPGLRYLEKYAVKMGGADNHRLGLYDMYLVKDNHIRAAGGVRQAIERIQRTRRDLPLEIEVESLEQLDEALRPEVDRILVDNRTPAEVRRAVEKVDAWFKANPPDNPRMRAGARRWPEIEVSGGIKLDNVREYAETGTDFISVGALTHSARAFDLSLEVEEIG
jgi:nicotinate-nucleotide pyrophosphorylase (carboxylating)